ncbi:tyrosine-type recombinase/integrase [Actinokineospora sp. NPDC004072]
MGHVQDRWYRAKVDADTGKPVLNDRGKPVREKTPLYGKGDRYRVRWVDSSGRERAKSFPDRQKSQAEAFLGEVESELRRGTYIDPDAGKVTFEVFGKRWLASQTFEESTREAVELRLRLHVFPHLGGRRLDSIRPSDVRDWLKALQDKGLSESYRQVIFVHVQAILSAAVDDERIRKNPCQAASVQKPQVPARKVVPWTAERVHAVRDAMSERYRVTVTLGGGLGLRQGEVFGLSPDDLGWDNDVVRVQRQVKIVGGKPCFGLPKGGKTREVPLPHSVGQAVREHMDAFAPLEVTLPWQHPGGELVTVPVLVWSRDRTVAWRPVYNQWTWAPALKRAGVTPLPRVDGFHALRHFYASTLLDAGETVTALSAYLGHADPGFTLKVYTHLMPSSKQRTRRAVDAVFGGLEPVAA